MGHRILSMLAAAVLSAATLTLAGEDEPVLTKTDTWRCFYTFGTGQGENGKPYTSVHLPENILRAVAPPADWFKPDFQDASWVPLRGGLESDVTHLVRQAYFRACFNVADPAAARGLRLLVAVRGGAVVYVNGEEVGRIALPAGAVTAETWADTYPLEAYNVKQADGKLKWLADFEYGAPYTNGVGHSYMHATGDKYPMTNRYQSWSSFVPNLSKEEWEKLNSLRNRKVDVEIPQKLLLKGRNVVAFALAGSKIRVLPGRDPGDYPRNDIVWPHASLLDVKLTCAAPGAASAARNGLGLQAWTADSHQRLFSFDYPPYGAPSARIDLVGARNGAFSGQIAVRSSTAIAGLSAAAGDLAGPGGAKIPASAIQVRYGMPSPAKVISAGSQFGFPPALKKYLANYSGELSGVPEQERTAKLLFFDRLSPQPPAEVPANSCQPIWVTVRVPKDAAPGDYRGALTLKAGGEMTVPVTLKVAGWTLPDPKDFTIMVGMEQSPWGVLAAYPKAQPWSDEHFRLMERSFKMLAELGSDVVIVPIQAPSEYGNRQDSLVRWVKMEGGGYDYDFTRLDRYLDLALKCLERVRVINVVVADPYPKNPAQAGAMVLDKATGKQERLQASPQTEEGAKLWAACAKAVYAHMKEKGLADRMVWGQIHDFPIPGDQKPFLEAVPEVGWSRGSHQGKLGNDSVKYAATILILPSDPKNKTTGHWSLMGWSTPGFHVVFPRIENRVLTVDTFADPFAFRLLPEKSLVHGARGVGRMGFDYWGNYAAGWTVGGSNTLMNMLELSWPGPDGAEGTARFEVFREGIQEAEARIAIERILVGGAGKTPEGEKAWDMLDDRVREVGFIPAYWPTPMAQYYTGWQERSRRLYETAAAVAKK